MSALLGIVHTGLITIELDQPKFGIMVHAVPAKCLQFCRRAIQPHALQIGITTVNNTGPVRGNLNVEQQ